MRRFGPAALWVLFTVVAVLSGLVAVALIGRSVSSGSGPVLSAAQVSESLKSRVDAEPTNGPTRTTASSPATGGHQQSSTQPTTDTAPSIDSQPSTDSQPGASPKPTTDSQPGASPKPTIRPTPSSTGQPSTSQQAAVVRTLSSRGGSVVAQCRAGSVYLKSWSPANGFRVDEVKRGPAAEAEIKFLSEASEVKLAVRCRSGVPVGEQETSGDDEGSGDD